MARNIKEIAEGLSAEIIGQVPDTGGGAFGAARLAQSAGASSEADGTGQGLIGLFHDAPEELDAIVEDAMRTRRLHAWCPGPEDFAALESMAEETGRTLNEVLDEAVRLLLQQWSSKQAESTPSPASENDTATRRPIWEIAQELAAAVPENVWEEWPHNPEGIDLETADAGDPQTRRKLIEELGRRMNRLSETAYCAGWSRALNEWLPALCEQAVTTGKVQPFGATAVCPGLAARLLAMREKLGHWVVPAVKGGYEPYLPPEKA